MMSWEGFPMEIRLAVLEELMQDGCSLAGFATVSREWQMVIEPYNFSRIKLTPARLADFGQMLHRNRSLVRYIWLCLELKEYDCTECDAQDPELYSISNVDNTLIATSIQNLFTTLSVWEPGNSLLLDISVYSLSDSKHWFKYLTFEPDVAFDIFRRNQQTVASTKVRPTDHRVYRHGWIDGSQNSTASYLAIEKIFGEIFGESPFDNEEQEDQWWQQLPLVPAVTGLLLRQQSRRRWRPATLARMFARLPGLQEIHYEPWREWDNSMQKWTDQSLQRLFESLSCSQLQRLVIFENFDQTYPAGYGARELSWKWPNLTWLALTSRLLVPQERSAELDDMLQTAAAAAMNMPNLETMEIWNGEKGLVMLFRYQRNKRGQPAEIICKGTWELTLRPLVIQAWDSVSLKHCGQGNVIIKELLDITDSIKSHGDAIRHLELSRPVVRPVSLRQIQMKHTI
ncbi:hypothetical protein BPOR_0722g00080 [Botrytis porri]|uniref:DUF6546 domain-containing protein n=1 Tax=Botrytis porri TaxID=87229 RepID=A0A4Z1KFN5_9HELO|nr:hypothetical protein BPOR_0722g00080 [Botrytis porri]